MAGVNPDWSILSGRGFIVYSPSGRKSFVEENISGCFWLIRAGHNEAGWSSGCRAQHTWSGDCHRYPGTGHNIIIITTWKHATHSNTTSSLSRAQIFTDLKKVAHQAFKTHWPSQSTDLNVWQLYRVTWYQKLDTFFSLAIEAFIFPKSLWTRSSVY